MDITIFLLCLLLSYEVRIIFNRHLKLLLFLFSYSLFSFSLIKAPAHRLRRLLIIPLSIVARSPLDRFVVVENGWGGRTRGAQEGAL